VDLNKRIRDAMANSGRRPKGIRFGLQAFLDLEASGHITRGSGGPAGLEWATNVPFYASDIYAWCDPTFDSLFELPPG
jgi:hypothetical protein